MINIKLFLYCLCTDMTWFFSLFALSNQKMHLTNEATGFPSVITLFSAPNYLDAYGNKVCLLLFLWLFVVVFDKLLTFSLFCVCFRELCFDMMAM
jgi:hypothetical protein